MRPLRNGLYAAGIPVENTKGEAETGQEELNIKYAPALDCAEYHTIAKHAVKEIAWAKGRSATFLPKWHRDKVGSSSHVHQSLFDKDGNNVFCDPDGEYGMSETMRHYLAGLIKYAPDYTYFLAPYVNSYKRFQKGTFAPTKTVWSVDNRTAGFRLCGEGTKALRVECRIGGSDLNPYLALAAQIAAGLKGIEDKLPLDRRPPATSTRPGGRRKSRRPCATRARPCASRNSCARPSPMRWSTTMPAPPNGSRKNSTGWSPITRSPAASSGRKGNVTAAVPPHPEEAPSAVSKDGPDAGFAAHPSRRT
jgi:glutamine synthetase